MKNKYNWIIGFLVGMNILLLGTVWFSHRRPPHPERQEVRKLVEKTLQFNKAQSEQYDVLIDEHQRDLRAINDEILPLKSELFQMVASPEDTVKTRELSEKIAQLIVKQDVITLNHFKKVRNTICNKDQKILLDHLLSEILAKMSHQGGPPPPRGPEGRRPE